MSYSKVASNKVEDEVSSDVQLDVLVIIDLLVLLALDFVIKTNCDPLPDCQTFGKHAAGG